MHNPGTSPLTTQSLIMDLTITKDMAESYFKGNAMMQLEEEAQLDERYLLGVSGGGHHFKALMEVLDEMPLMRSNTYLQSITTEVHKRESMVGVCGECGEKEVYVVMYCICSVYGVCMVWDMWGVWFERAITVSTRGNGNYCFH